MICRAIIPKTVKEALEINRSAPLIEIRLEEIKGLSKENILDIFKTESKIIATCRPGSMDEKSRLQILTWAIEAGATYVDVEIESDNDFKEEIVKVANINGTQIIISYHNYDKTPDIQTLKEIIDNCFKDGAHIAKVACFANSKMDAARIISLLDDSRPIIPLGMGKEGEITRVAAPILGAPFTFAPLKDEMTTAPGQIASETLEKVYTLLNIL
ncbi:MAG: type I 3-dehydroquinate dehydratase [Deltaproteobacteria bacterium]|nr:type I 3-dehydroquinate dehydratase [Deltaproteobacteria bacterium]